jgi:hypothetical protein
MIYIADIELENRVVEAAVRCGKTVEEFLRDAIEAGPVEPDGPNVRQLVEEALVGDQFEKIRPCGLRSRTGMRVHKVGPGVPGYPSDKGSDARYGGFTGSGSD